MNDYELALINVYVDNPGDFNDEEALELAIQLDQEANENFLASIEEMQVQL
jgi:hypothetical protein